MTDYSTQNSSEKLTPMNQDVNPSYNFNVANLPKSVTYKTPCLFGLACVLIPFFIMLITISCIIIIQDFNQTPVYFSLIPFFCSFIFYIFLSIMTIFTKIHIDNSVGIITKTEVKFLFCFNKSMKIQINDVKRVFTMKEQVDEDDKRYKFRIFFRLLNGKTIEGCEISSRNECNRAMKILRNGLPKNVIFNDNIEY